MQNNNQKAPSRFERTSEVLRHRIHSTNQKMNMIEKGDDRDIINERNEKAGIKQDEPNADYLFGNDLSNDNRSNKKIIQIEYLQRGESEELEIQIPDKAIPVKRTASRAYSESFKQPKKMKTKPKYKKEENVGNALIQQQKIDTIFKFLCEPNRMITVNSLGHALQKFKVNFEVKDIVDMLKLHLIMAGSPRDENQLEQNQENLDLSVKLSEQQFKDLYRTIRKKNKK